MTESINKDDPQSPQDGPGITSNRCEHGDAPDFAVGVPESGYRWWYVDGISDDGAQGIVIIAFIGSVFSPYYFKARQKGLTDPHDHCAINVGLYRRDTKLWAMTERSAASLQRDAGSFQVGDSALHWDGQELRIDIHERSVPFGRRMQGQIRLRPELRNATEFELDAAGRHTWQPISPFGRIDVDMRKPAERWSGTGYFDTNAGSRALEDDFIGWNWSRHADRTSTRITYAADLVSGEHRSMALSFDESGDPDVRNAPPRVTLPTTGWRVQRETRADVVPVVHRTLEDTPFYARSILATDPADAAEHRIMHESLSLQRFASGWVRFLLPFRMPRLP